MKRRFIIVVIVVCISGLKACPLLAQDPITAVISAGVKRAIKAMDLKIQRLQTNTIWLQNAQKVIENTMAKLRLEEISNWSEKQRSLYEEYFDELWRVKNTVSYYYKIKNIVDTQRKLVEEYKRSFSLFNQDKHFSSDEITYIGDVHEGIINESLNNLDKLFLVINSFSTSMSDGNRLKIIDGVASSIEENYRDLKTFNLQNSMLSLQRSNSEAEITVMKKMYGIQ